MRIKKIQISNFKGFYDEYTIDLSDKCKNLLVYGENGSGKSSLYQALELFLESSSQQLDFKKYRNIFVNTDDPRLFPNLGFIKLTLRKDKNSGETTYEWSPNKRETAIPVIIEANKAKGFFDYKSLLETYFLHRHEQNVNIFNLLINNILSNAINNISNRPFKEEWSNIQNSLQSPMTKLNLDKFEEQIRNLNQGLISQIQELESKSSEILSTFDYNIKISFDFQGIGYNYASKKEDREITGQSIILRVSMANKPFSQHHIFLNEAKLSAIALSIYLASLLIVPQPDLKLLVLDDVLIGLDMSNRLPILDIINNFFPQYQIIFTTYDRSWFEMVRLRTKENEWKYVEFYSGSLQDFDVPILIETQDLLNIAHQHLNNKDYKACAVYVRSAFEIELKKLVLKKKLKVPYTKTPEKLSSQDFWQAITNEGNLLQTQTISNIELYRKFILNPLSHSELTNTYERELRASIQAIKALRDNINAILKSTNSTSS